MNQVTINLSETGISIARERAAARGLAGVEEYLSEIVEASLRTSGVDAQVAEPESAESPELAALNTRFNANFDRIMEAAGANTRRLTGKSSL